MGLLVRLWIGDLIFVRGLAEREYQVEYIII
jgi:hypothetical protein